jgi:hypothetical protein
MTQRRIDSYFLRSSSSRSSTASTVIDVDSDEPTDDEQPVAISSNPKRRASSTASSQRRMRKRCVLSSPLSAQPIESYFGAAQSARRSSSLPISMSDWQLDEEDFLSLSQLLVARSAPQPAAATRPAQPVVRRALSDISNVQREARRRNGQAMNARRKEFYDEVRRRFAHPLDRTKCLHCGIRDHSAIHHADDFKRNGAVSLH